MTVQEGGCLCGAVRYRVKNERHGWLRSGHRWFVPPAGVESFEKSALLKK